MYVILVLVATRTTYTVLTGLGVALRLCTVTHTGMSGKATTKRNVVRSQDIVCKTVHTGSNTVCACMHVTFYKIKNYF